MITLNLPLSVKQSKKKNFILNLNVYRNAHYQTLNTVKIRFKKAIKPQLIKIPKLGNIQLIYSLFSGSYRLCDVANVCSVVDKFFSDAIVEEGIIEDDNYKILDQVSYRFGGIDTDNPRVEVQIIELKDQSIKDKPMQITITEAEIHTAIESHINNIMTLKEGTKVEIDLKATRGDQGYTALIDITAPGSGSSAKAVVEPNPAGIDNRKPIEEKDPPKPVAKATPKFTRVEPEKEESKAASVQQEDTPPVKTTKSLFGGLKSPDNSTEKLDT